MKAEIQARTGDEGGAKNTLNTLLSARTKAGATPLTCDNYQGMSGLSALQMVQLQSASNCGVKAASSGSTTTAGTFR